MRSKMAKIKNSTFIKNVIVLVTGTAAAQGVAMALSPIITRLYGPENFGLMGTFNAIISIVAPIAALTYPIAIVLPKKDQDAKGLIKISLLIASLIAFLFTIALLLFGNNIADMFNISELSYLIYLIPLVIIFAGLVQVTEQWLIRKKQFTINAKVTFYQSIIINGGKAGVGFFYPFGTVLVLFTAIGNGLKAFMLFFFSRKKNNNKSIKMRRTNKKGLKSLAKEYYDFPLYRSPQVFLNGVSQSLPVLLLTSFFGPASAGFYAIGRTVLSMPSSLIGKSVGDVFYPRIAEAYNNKENTTNLILRATTILSLIGIIPFGTIVLFGPFLFSLVFGSDWYMAGEYARWTALWVYFMFINQPSVRSLPVLSAQGFHLKFTIATLTIRMAALSAGYFFFNSDLIAVAFFGVSGAILNIILILMTLNISRRKENFLDDS